MTLVMSNVATSAVTRMLPPWLRMTMRLRGMRSASAPPMMAMMVTGMENDAMTSARASGESSANSSTSQPRVIICMFIAMYEASEPTNIHRKST